MIEIKNITKFYGTHCAINDISFSVPSNSITGLVGLNGAGKSTLIKTIAGVHYADSGIILVNGLNIQLESLQLKEQIGYVPEKETYPADFTVFECLYYRAKIFFSQFSKNQQYEKIYTIAELCTIQDVLHKRTRELSKGYKQRLSLAIALLHNPSVLLLDEPTSGLDPKQVVAMRNLISTLSKEKTILISTHLMQEIEALCSNISIIHKGKHMFIGSDIELCQKTKTKNVEDAFLQICETEDGKGSV